ncbi:glycosyltransferase family 2 protein [Novosphingobium sp.]|uniref:glycosyltransferase family 2 protein n=1 Tax=Novosphingobium sp. TaxID=1874826 RepID=UPI003B51F7AA
MSILDPGFHALSPRLSPRRVPWIGTALGWAGPVLFVVLFWQSLIRSSLFGWSVGIAYIGYDTFLLAFTAIQLWPLRKSMRSVPPHDGTLPPASLAAIVAAHNEDTSLRITIDTLMAQDGPPDLIVLADDGSSDDSADVLRRFYGLEAPALGQMSPPSPVLPALRWLRLPHGGKARALNAAIPQINTDLVLTIDADTLLEPGALKAMRDAFAAEPQLVAATGVLIPMCGKRPIERVFQWFQRYEYVRNFLSRFAWMQQNGLLLISGAFAGFRRSALVCAGGFDPESMVEDYELIHRMHRFAHENGHDWRVRVIGGAVASTDAPASPMAFMRQRRRWFGGFLQTQHWNRDMVGNAQFGRLGTRMLVVKALDTVQPIYGLIAFAILITLCIRGTFPVVGAIVLVMLVKVVIDLTFHLWSITLYRRWTGQGDGLGLGPALFASIVEPFTFQLLRHAGACWGWIAFLNGGGGWGKQDRTAIAQGAVREPVAQP